MNTSLKLGTALALALAAMAAQAGTVVSNRAAIGSATVFDFESEDGLVIATGNTYNFGNGTLSADDQLTVGQNNADLGDNGVWGAGNHFLSFDKLGSMSLDVNFSQAVRAFAFDLNAWQDLGGLTPASINVSYYAAGNILLGSHSVTLNPAFGASSYDSFLSGGYDSGAVNIARVVVQGDGVVLDNLTYTTAVPEAGTSALLALGLAAVGWVGRRRRA